MAMAILSLDSLSASPSLAVDPHVSVAGFEITSTTRPHIAASLPFAEQVRRAMIRNRMDTSHSEAIVGKTVDGFPLEGHLHAHYLTTDEDGDGRLDHVTLYAPCRFDSNDLAAIGAMRTIFRRGNRPDARLVLTGLGEAKQFGDAPIFAQSRKWRSMTPFSLPRFANRGAGKSPRPRDLPEAQLVRELRVRGLPEPISIKRIEGYKAGARPLVRWLEFQTTRFNGTQGYGLAGFEIEFAEPINGPIAVGFGCHFGLGLFLPI
ncbi:MAG: type I-U CRISPR-associated protein Csb2 [Acidobacteria bacterium]|nr:type I-U CRISPR-associated protein Csb2 [Acidobacteriota bacterium]